jgi:UDP-N-acetylglucosamine transferase subunit ALG13
MVTNMVFVTIGSTHFPFTRLIVEVDRLAAAGVLSDVVAQIGETPYEPAHCTWQRHMTQSDFRTNMTRAAFVISHAGCGTLEEGLRLQKKLIVMPRRVASKEATDDHQLEIVRLLVAANRILVASEVEDLIACIRQVSTWLPCFATPRAGNPVADYILKFIETELA